MGLGGMVEAAVEFGLALAEGARGVGGEQPLTAEQPGQGDAAEAAAGLPEEMATVEEGLGHESVPFVRFGVGRYGMNTYWSRQSTAELACAAATTREATWASVQFRRTRKTPGEWRPARR